MKLDWIGSARGRRLLVVSGLVSLAAIVGMAAASAPASAREATAASAGTLRIAITGAPDPFDPALLGDNRSIELAQNVYEGVLGVNNKAQIVPAVATTWSSSANGLVYTFHLRHGLKFQNGDPVTANDFVYTFNRSLNPKTAAGASFFLADIKGANAVRRLGLAQQDAVHPATKDLAELPGVKAHIGGVGTVDRSLDDDGRRAVPRASWAALDQTLHVFGKTRHVERAVLHPDV